MLTSFVISLMYIGAWDDKHHRYSYILTSTAARWISIEGRGAVDLNVHIIGLNCTCGSHRINAAGFCNMLYACNVDIVRKETLDNGSLVLSRQLWCKNNNLQFLGFVPYCRRLSTATDLLYNLWTPLGRMLATVCLDMVWSTWLLSAGEPTVLQGLVPFCFCKLYSFQSQP